MRNDRPPSGAGARTLESPVRTNASHADLKAGPRWARPRHAPDYGKRHPDTETLPEVRAGGREGRPKLNPECHRSTLTTRPSGGSTYSKTAIDVDRIHPRRGPHPIRHRDNLLPSLAAPPLTQADRPATDPDALRAAHLNRWSTRVVGAANLTTRSARAKTLRVSSRTFDPGTAHRAKRSTPRPDARDVTAENTPLVRLKDARGTLTTAHQQSV